MNEQEKREKRIRVARKKEKKAIKLLEKSLNYLRDNLEPSEKSGRIKTKISQAIYEVRHTMPYNWKEGK